MWSSFAKQCAGRRTAPSASSTTPKRGTSSATRLKHIFAMNAMTLFTLLFSFYAVVLHNSSLERGGGRGGLLSGRAAGGGEQGQVHGESQSRLANLQMALKSYPGCMLYVLYI